MSAHDATRPASHALALAKTLDEQRALYDDLLAVANEEERAIVDADVASLTALVERQEQVLETLAALETERMTHVAALAAAFNLDPEAVTLSDLAARVLPDESRPLLASGVALRQVAEEAQHANARNRQLLEQSGRVVEQWIRYLRSMITSGGGYDAEGGGRGESGPRVLDRSA